MADDVMIRIRGVWKRYGLRLPWASRQGGQDGGGPWALRDINLEVRRGEALGIIGRNGAGKSTLLKLLAGVTPVTRGEVEIRGSFFPMIELNAGLHMELTGRENVYLLGAIMGLSRAEVRARMAQIEEFCELGEYFDQPVRKYSSGMLSRLGFGVATNVEADILLVDEVLGVGDFAFQNKCFSHFRQRRGSQTLLYVTHNMISLPYVCDRTIYLEEGAIKVEGPSQEIAAQYERESLLYPRAKTNVLAEDPRKRDTTGHVEIFSAQITDYAGRAVDVVERDQGFCLSLEGFSHVLVKSPLLIMSIVDSMGTVCWWNFSAEDGYTFGPLKGPFRIVTRIPPMPLRSGQYTINFGLRDGDGFINLERLWALPLFLKGEMRAHGVLAASAEWCLYKEDELSKS